MRRQFRILLQTLSLVLLFCLAGCATAGETPGRAYDAVDDPMPGSPDPLRPGRDLDTPNHF